MKSLLDQLADDLRTVHHVVKTITTAVEKARRPARERKTLAAARRVVRKTKIIQGRVIDPGKD